MRSSILLSCIGCTVLAMLLQLVLFNATSSSIIAGQTAQINRTTLQNLSDDVYNRFKRIENSLITICEHKSFVRELADAGSTDELARKYAALAYEMAGSAFESDEHLVALYIYSMDHTACPFRTARVSASASGRTTPCSSWARIAEWNKAITGENSKPPLHAAETVIAWVQFIQHAPTQ